MNCRKQKFPAENLKKVWLDSAKKKNEKNKASGGDQAKTLK